MMETGWVGAIVVGAIQLGILAAAWGDMRRQVASNRERQDERHAENRDTLATIDEKLDRVNGSVGRHEVKIGEHDRRLDWIERRKQD